MRRLVKRVKAGVDRRVALAHRLLHGVTREVVDEYLLDQVRHHIRTRRVAAPGGGPGTSPPRSPWRCERAWRSSATPNLRDGSGSRGRGPAPWRPTAICPAAR